MIRRSIAIQAAVALVGATCAFAVAAENNGRVTGRVVDAQTKAPVAANVSVLDPSGHTKQTKTDKDGVFNVVGLEPGKVTVSFVASGFASQSITCAVPPGEVGVFDIRAYHSATNPPHVSYHCRVAPQTADRTVLW